MSNEVDVDPEKKPILIQHGGNMTAEDFLVATSWPLRLTELGYDVWLGSNSGDLFTSYAGDATTQAEIYGVINPMSMGTSDLPAMIDLILEETGASKLTYMGYS